MTDQSPASPDVVTTEALITPPSINLEMPPSRVAEYPARATSGWLMVGLCLFVGSAGVGLVIVGIIVGSSLMGLLGVGLFTLSIIVGGGLTAVSPGQARVLQLLGRYRGTLRADGLQWVNPLTTRRQVSTRIRNHETGTAKVNDADGNPIEIAAVVVWKVDDTAKAIFEVDDFTEFVAIQTETAVRHIASGYPYDAHADGRLSLLDNAGEITQMLAQEIGVRVASAGVQIVESRITRLSFAPEIAQAMLRRQQAAAVVAARQQIVAGAVGMVQMALHQLSEKDVVELDEERKAAMVSNLMVVLCGDREAQPVVNTGSLYN